MIYKNEKDILNAKQFFFLIYGTDEGKVKLTSDKLREKIDCETVKIDLDEYEKEPTKLEDELRAASLFSEKQLVFLDLRNDSIKPKITAQIAKTIAKIEDIDNYLLILCHKLTPTSPLRKLFEAQKKMVIMPCYPAEISDIRLLLEDKLCQENIRIAPDAKQLFLQKAKGNFARVNHEIEKLLLYKQKDEIINFQDVQKLTGQFEELYVSDLIYAAFSGESTLVDNILRELELEAIPLLLAIRRHITLLTQINMAISQNQNLMTVIDGLRPPIFFKTKKILAVQVRKWSEVKLLKFYTKSLDIEYQVKWEPLVGLSQARMLLLEIVIE